MTEQTAILPLGTENIIKVLEGIEKLGVAVGTIMQDGKVNATDLITLFELIKEYQSLIDSFKAVSMVIPEVKDLDTMESVVVLTKLVAVVKNIIASTKVA